MYALRLTLRFPDRICRIPWGLTLDQIGHMYEFPDQPGLDTKICQTGPAGPD